jgi:hypothetical protein
MMLPGAFFVSVRRSTARVGERNAPVRLLGGRPRQLAGLYTNRNFAKHVDVRHEMLTNL